MTRPPAALVFAKIVLNVAMSGFGTSLAKLTQATFSPLAKEQAAEVLPPLSAVLESDFASDPEPELDPESEFALEPVSDPGFEAASDPEFEPVPRPVSAPGLMFASDPEFEAESRPGPASSERVPDSPVA